MLMASDTPEAISKSMGLGLMDFAGVYARSRPDILLVLGDRFEMHAAALAALPFKIPVAHLHGGELSFGAIDDALRHSLTKLSHLHFVSTEEYARRVVQMGEEKWRITVSGAPALDEIREVKLLSLAKFNEKFNLHLKEDFLLVTFHPATLEHQDSERQIEEVLAAFEESARPILFTAANADTSGRIINARINEFCRRHSSAELAANLGQAGYFSAMNLAAAMVGNSSSGILEAASFELPVVNIGIRQEGRLRGANVIDTDNQRQGILAAIERATSDEFRRALKGMQNPYYQGGASELIVKRLKEVEFGERLIVKRFQDLPA